MTLNYIIIGKRIREIRKKRKMSQSALSEKIDRTPTYVSYIESGVKGMSLDTLVSIANALDISADVLLSDNITANSESIAYDIAEILHDCSLYERNVIIESMKNLKNILQTNGFLLNNRQK